MAKGGFEFWAADEVLTSSEAQAVAIAYGTSLKARWVDSGSSQFLALDGGMAKTAFIAAERYAEDPHTIDQLIKFLVLDSGGDLKSTFANVTHVVTSHTRHLWFGMHVAGTIGKYLPLIACRRMAGQSNIFALSADLPTDARCLIANPTISSRVEDCNRVADSIIANQPEALIDGMVTLFNMSGGYTTGETSDASQNFTIDEVERITVQEMSPDQLTAPYENRSLIRAADRNSLIWG